MKIITSKQESSIMKSKKFVASMTWNLGWLSLIAMGIWHGTGDSILLSMTWVAGATQITYIGGQAALDTFVRKAAILSTSQDQPTSQTKEYLLEKEEIQS